GDRQGENAHATNERHYNRDDDRDNGPPDEKLGHFKACFASPLLKPTRQLEASSLLRRLSTLRALFGVPAQQLGRQVSVRQSLPTSRQCVRPFSPDECLPCCRHLQLRPDSCPVTHSPLPAESPSRLFSCRRQNVRFRTVRAAKRFPDSETSRSSGSSQS